MFEALFEGEFAQDVAIVFTLLLLEAVLSFDNAAILAAMVRKLPVHERKKALLYGLVGAYALRVAAILLAAWLIRTPILKVLGGAYLIWLAIRHFYHLIKHREEHHKHANMAWLVRLGLPPLVATIIAIELVDLAFAIDQVIVAVGFTDKIGLIIMAALIGILFLRLAAAVLARVMDWLPLLEHMAYIAVGYVGVKLVLLYPFPFGGYPEDGVHIPTGLSIGVTLGLFAVPIFLKLVFKVPKSRPGLHSEPVDEQQAPPEAETGREAEPSKDGS